MTTTPVSPKVTTGTGSGALVLVIVWILGSFGFTVPPEVAAALTLLASSVAAWATPDHLRSLGARYQERIDDYQGRHEDDGDGVPDNAGDHLEIIPARDATSDTKVDATR